MDKLYLNLLLPLIAGLLLGFVLYSLGVFGQPVWQSASVLPNVTTNVTLPTNATLPTTANQTPSEDPLANPTHSNVSITVLLSSACDPCNREVGAYMLAINNSLNGTNSTIISQTNLSSNSSAGVSLISKYPITKLPAIIISIDGNAIYTFETAVTRGYATKLDNHTLLFQGLGVPYYDQRTGQAVGILQGIGINASNCPNCIDAGLYIKSLESSPGFVVFSSKSVLAENSSDAQTLIRQYNITKLPTVLLSANVQDYGFYNQSIEPYGSLEGNWFVLRNTTLPYVDLSANHSVKGAITVKLIRNSSCTDCFNVSYLLDYLVDAASLTIVNTTTYEANSTGGVALIHKYNMTMIPGMLFSSDVGDYPGFREEWLAQNNTVEKDGWFVFRNQDKMQVPYQNVSN